MMHQPKFASKITIKVMCVMMNMIKQKCIHPTSTAIDVSNDVFIKLWIDDFNSGDMRNDGNGNRKLNAPNINCDR